ncbi:MAG TPA: secretin N-terminal domain-containing protein, partial [Lacipirellulaceae bacterium]|nr:secretin N-terminal domain-containing protein [Lacipirellulaceae bacterium]
TSRASSVVINLKEYFADDMAADESDRFFRWWNDDSSNEGPATLGKRRKLRFIWDPDTNTILVQNASGAQLEVIRELIRIYDQPIGEDAVARRRTDVIEVRYSRAQDIATALKEVYRDLLSSKDKEFQSQRGDDNNRGQQRNIYYRFSTGNENSKTTPVKMAFEGALSIGVDTVSNTLIISAEEQIFDNVLQIVKVLDQQAKPDTVVQVHELRGALSPSELQTALRSVLAQPWPGGKPDPGAQQGGQRGRGGDPGNRGGDRRRGRDRN